VKLVLLLAALSMITSCQGPRVRTEWCDLHWTPLVEEDGEVRLDHVQATPRPGVSIESLTVEFRDGAGEVLESIVARPVPESGFVSVGQIRVPKKDGVVGEILVRHSHSPSPLRVTLCSSM